MAMLSVYNIQTEVRWCNDGLVDTIETFFLFINFLYRADNVSFNTFGGRDTI